MRRQVQWFRWHCGKDKARIKNRRERLGDFFPRFAKEKRRTRVHARAIVGNEEDFVILEVKHRSKTRGCVNYFSVDALVGGVGFSFFFVGRSSSSKVAFQFSAYKDKSELATAKV